MSEELPTPIVAADVDLRDLDGFMLNVERLLASELWALTKNAPEAFRAAVGLWARAWKQTPAATLPGDMATLAAFADVSEAKLKKLWHLIMRGFVLCSDGRYHHRVLGPEALKAWEKKKAFTARRDADRKRLSDWREKQRAPSEETTDETPDETRFTHGFETGFVAEGQGQGQGSKKERERDAPAVNGHAARKPAVNRATRLPENFEVPPEWIAEAERKRREMGLPEANLRPEAQQFAIWHTTRPEAQQSFDWRKTWLSWALKARASPDAGSKPRPKFVPL